LSLDPARTINLGQELFSPIRATGEVPGAHFKGEMVAA